MLRGRRLLALMVVAAVVLVLGGREVRDHINDKNRAADEDRLATATLLAQAEQAEEWGLETEMLAAARRDLLATLPAEPELADLIEQLVELESATGTVLTILSVGDPLPVNGPDDAGEAGPGQHWEIALELEVYGPETLVRSFVGGLRDLPRLVVVDKVSLYWSLQDGQDGQDGQQDGEQPPAASLEPAGVAAVLEARAFTWAPDFYRATTEREVMAP